MLLCDFHIHTTWSDGSVPLREVVDIYGQAGFDVIAVTDHVYNKDGVIAAFADNLNKTVTEENFGRYMEEVAAETMRALAKYGMLVIPGVEITKNYLSEQESAHVLLVDIKWYVSADLSWDDILGEGRRQGALVIACHPHYTDHEVHDTLYFWNNRQKFSRHFDAWEVANRSDLFSVVSLNNYPILANGDFHKAQHLYSWKTLLPCEKEVEAIKACIRDNRGVAITLFRNGTARE